MLFNRFNDKSLLSNYNLNNSWSMEKCVKH